MRRVFVIVALIASLALAPAALAAEKPGPVTWLAFSTVNSGKTEDAVKLTLKDKAFYDDMMAKGVIQSWGLVTPINHRTTDGWNHGQWVTVSDWGKVDQWTGAFFKYVNGLPEKEKEARMAAAEQIFVDGSHFDTVARHLVYQPAEPGSTPPRYFMISTFRAKPGQEDSLTGLYKDFVVPIMKKLYDDGVVSGYGWYVQELHENTNWTHRAWYALPNLAAIDRVQAAFAAAAGPAIDAWADATMEHGAHDDQVLMILHLGMPGAE